MSNLYCLPGRAGGSPGYASRAEMLFQSSMLNPRRAPLSSMTKGGTTRVATRSLEALPCADDPGTQKASSARIMQLRAKADKTLASNAWNQAERGMLSILAGL